MYLERISISHTDLVGFCQKYRIRKLALFGSVLRDDFNHQSDVDVVVEFKPEAKVGFFELIDIEMELSALMGRKVDLNTYGFLSPRIQKRVLEQEYILLLETENS